MTAEVLQIDVEAAQRRVERMRFHATTMNESAQSLLKVMYQARELEDHVTLSYQSWPAFLVDVFGNEPLRLTREARREVVAEMSNAGMSTRAIAPLVGVSKSQVAADIEVSTSGQVPPDVTPAPVDFEGMAVNPSTGEVIDGPTIHAEPTPVTTEHTLTEKVKTTTGLDGKEYKRPEPVAQRRRSLVDDAVKARQDLWAAVTRIQTLMQDDRYQRNKTDIRDALHPATRLATEVFNDLYNNTSESEEN